MDNAQFAVVGLDVMGRNLALNIEEKGFSVAVTTRTTSKVTDFMATEGAGKRFVACMSPEELVARLERPRRIMLMVKAGAPTDQVIDQYAALLEPGDLLIDGGNALFTDTIRRNRALGERGLLFIGTGVSGGEEGARHGPSIMPGGQPEAWELVKPVFTRIAAQVDGEPCCTHIGPDGAGHYVKMVHNGIEYGDMQLICEAYFLMAEALRMETEELAHIFAEWNRGELNSYLIEITSHIFQRTDPDTGKPMVDVIQDRAGQKGTGKWTSQNALDLGTPAPTIAEAVFARCLSAIKEERVAASRQLRGPRQRFRGDRTKFIQAIHDALYASKICSYAQGFALMRDAAREYDWTLNFGEIAMIWRGGCIIRAQFLHRIKEAFSRTPDLANLLLDPFFKSIIAKNHSAWRQVVGKAAAMGIPAPAFSSALAYFDMYRRARLPANLLQAQRDYFGAHTYERVDRPAGEFFHTEWTR